MTDSSFAHEQLWPLEGRSGHGERVWGIFFFFCFLPGFFQNMWSFQICQAADGVAEFMLQSVRCADCGLG